MSDTTPRTASSPSHIPQGVLTVEQAIDRMPRVGLSRWAWFALMLAFFFMNYDLTVFALSIPSMLAGFAATPADLAWPVSMNLVGYAVGAYIFGVISDRRGRQVGLFLTIALLGLGAGLSALAWDMPSLSFFRFLTGCGMGAVLSICATYIGEMAPKDRRGRYLALMSLVGGVILLIVGFASLPVVGALPQDGWRYLMGFGALVLLTLFFINRRDLMESPRWLAEHGLIEKATAVVRKMYGYAKLELGADVMLTHPVAPEGGDLPGSESPVRALFRRPLLGRLLIVLGFWFLFYITLYGFLSYLPLLLEGVGVETSNALFVTALTRAAPLIASLLVLFLIERWERRTMIIAGTLVFAGGLALIISGLGDGAATAGALLATAGVVFMASPAYTYTAEIFPTKSRSTAASIGDGVGHLGGAVSPFIILPILISFGAVPAGITMIALLLASAGLIRLGVRTRNRSLDEINS